MPYIITARIVLRMSLRVRLKNYEKFNSRSRHTCDLCIKNNFTSAIQTARRGHLWSIFRMRAEYKIKMIDNKKIARHGDETAINRLTYLPSEFCNLIMYATVEFSF